MTFIARRGGTAPGIDTLPRALLSPVLVSSQNANRDWLYYTHQPFRFFYLPASPAGLFFHVCSSLVSRQGNQAVQLIATFFLARRTTTTAWMAQFICCRNNFMNFMALYLFRYPAKQESKPRRSEHV